MKNLRSLLLNMALIGGFLAFSLESGHAGNVSILFDDPNVIVQPSPNGVTLDSINSKLDNVTTDPTLKPAVDAVSAKLDLLSSQLLEISTEALSVAFIGGMMKERDYNVSVLASYTQFCNKPDFFGVVSTNTWNYATCATALGQAAKDILLQNTTGVIP